MSLIKSEKLAKEEHIARTIWVLRRANINDVSEAPDVVFHMIKIGEDFGFLKFAFPKFTFLEFVYFEFMFLKFIL